MSTHLSLYVDTRINVKKELQASNNIDCPGFTFHCLSTHLSKLNITIPLCLQICQIIFCSRHESICCLLKSCKAEYISLLNATSNSILELNCLSFMQLRQCRKHCITHCLPWSPCLFSPQYYFYSHIDHFKRNVYTSLVFWIGSHKSKCVNTSYLLSE